MPIGDGKVWRPDREARRGFDHHAIGLDGLCGFEPHAVGRAIGGERAAVERSEQAELAEFGGETIPFGAGFVGELGRTVRDLGLGAWLVAIERPLAGIAGDGLEGGGAWACVRARDELSGGEGVGRGGR